MTSESVNPADCGGYYLHEAHSWREGFLYLHKRVCRGTAAINPPEVSGKTLSQICEDLGISEEPTHKHMLRFVRHWDEFLAVEFRCEGCGDRFTIGVLAFDRILKYGFTYREAQRRKNIGE